jgi:DNA-binding LytR/AlgR family response regulator
MMLKIAALDDERAYVEKIERLTRQYFKEKDIPCVFRGYDNHEHLLLDMEKEGDFDIFLLDMELNGHSGLTVARKIREWDKECAIVCVTNYVDYAPEAYEVSAFRFILKRELELKLPQMYDELRIRLHGKDERYFVVKTDSRTERLYFKDIMYVQKEKKQVVFYLKNGEKTCTRKTLDEVERELPEKDFIKIDRGCIINFAHMMSMKNMECRMHDGAVLRVSQARGREVKERVDKAWQFET